MSNGARRRAAGTWQDANHTSDAPTKRSHRHVSSGCVRSRGVPALSDYRGGNAGTPRDRTHPARALATNERLV